MSQTTDQLALDEQRLTEIVEEHQQFSELSEEERQQLLKYVNAVRDIEQARVDANQARADIEQAKGWRAVFERAPPETIPFIIYCVYVVGTVVTLGRVLESYTIWTAMILPLFVLSKDSIKESYRWLRGRFGSN